MISLNYANSICDKKAVQMGMAVCHRNLYMSNMKYTSVYTSPSLYWQKYVKHKAMTEQTHPPCAWIEHCYKRNTTGLTRRFDKQSFRRCRKRDVKKMKNRIILRVGTEWYNFLPAASAGKRLWNDYFASIDILQRSHCHGVCNYRQLFVKQLV